jgi:hypothetical protein
MLQILCNLIEKNFSFLIEINTLKNEPENNQENKNSLGEYFESLLFLFHVQNEKEFLTLTALITLFPQELDETNRLRVLNNLDYYEDLIFN